MRQSFFTALFGIIAVIFVILYFTEKNDCSTEASKLALADSSLVKADSSLALFQNLIKLPKLKEALLNDTRTAPIDYATLQHYVTYFHQTLDPNYDGSTAKIGIFPYGSWVSLKDVRGQIVNDNTIDGFRIIPLRYDVPVVKGGLSFKKDDVNFAIVFTRADTTGGHAEVKTLADDYNQPCPHFPCN